MKKYEMFPCDNAACEKNVGGDRCSQIKTAISRDALIGYVRAYGPERRRLLDDCVYIQDTDAHDVLEFATRLLLKRNIKYSECKGFVGYTRMAATIVQRKCVNRQLSVTGIGRD